MATVTHSGVQNLRGDAAAWTSKQVVLKAAELGYDTTNDRVKIGNGTKKFDERPNLLDSDHEAFIALLNNTYDGVDLTQKFAAEIANYASPWAWIKARITAGNFKGINIRDYIPFNLSAGTITDGTTSYNIGAKTMKARVAGINTYLNYGYPSGCTKHIDFITTSETIGTNIPWQTIDDNNGSTASPYPWLASKIYACLNGVNNVGTGFGGTTKGFNASSGGVLQLLPAALRNVITVKRLFGESRYSGSGTLTTSTAGDIHDMGELWLPTEVEVYGFPCNSQQADQYGINRSAYGSIQYPIFANNNRKQDMGRVHWWLSSVASGSSTHACNVNNNGNANTNSCTNAWKSAPV